MPQRILEYETAIITKAIKGRKMTKENHKIPRVIPIVIYTGRKKWNVEKYIEESQEKIEGEVKLGQYYVVDINEYTKEELEKDKLFLSKVMLMEKAKTEDEIIEVLSRAIEKEEKTEMIKLIKKIIIYIFEQKISKEEKEKLIKRIENKEARSMVFEVIKKENERLVKKGRAEGKRQGISEGIKQGIKQGTENIVIQMLKIGLNKDIICKVTNITKKEIEQIKINNENKEINNI